MGASESSRILIVGLDGSGKTAILDRYQNGLGPAAQGPAPTVGSSTRNVRVHNSKVEFLEVGGQQILRDTWPEYFFKDIQGVVFVVDSANSARIDEAREELHRLRDILRRVPCLILANKVDLLAPLTPTQVKEKMDTCLRTESLDASCGAVRLQPTSVMNGFGIAEGVEWLVQVMPVRLNFKDERVREEINREMNLLARNKSIAQQEKDEQRTQIANNQSRAALYKCLLKQEKAKHRAEIDSLQNQIDIMMQEKVEQDTNICDLQSTVQDLTEQLAQLKRLYDPMDEILSAGRLKLLTSSSHLKKLHDSAKELLEPSAKRSRFTQPFQEGSLEQADCSADEPPAKRSRVTQQFQEGSLERADCSADVQA